MIMPKLNNFQYQKTLVTMFSVFFSITAFSQTTDARFTPTDDYIIDETFFKLPPGRSIGATSGLAIHPNGSSFWVFDRCGSTDCRDSSLAPIMKFDIEGNHLLSFGENLYQRPHGLHVDREGNVWVTDDVGSRDIDTVSEGKGHQVFKFSPEGELLMTLGEPGIPGYGPDTFNMPSAVLVAPNGDIFVGDGHGPGSNARIVKFNSRGEYLMTWGSFGEGPNQFHTPHALAMDSAGRLFVGDRGNNRVLIFDQSGSFLDEWTQFGRPSGMFIDDNDLLYVADSSSSNTAQSNPGFEEGIRVGNVKDGRVILFIQDPDASGSQEGVVADGDGNIYGSLTAGMALRKYSLFK
ncbi:MAG: sugar lactone lactonase YvrE [Pseudohongiellaceae bacterium]|jgi:sugar lactone lactonase YvrE